MSLVETLDTNQIAEQTAQLNGKQKKQMVEASQKFNIELEKTYHKKFKNWCTNNDKYMKEETAKIMKEAINKME